MPSSKPPVSSPTAAPSQKPGAGSDVATVSWPGVRGVKSWPAMLVLSEHAAAIDTARATAATASTRPDTLPRRRIGRHHDRTDRPGNGGCAGARGVSR